MEFLTFEACWEYTVILTVILVALVVWRKDFRIPRPKKKRGIRR
jgi:hypothetical protein